MGDIIFIAIILVALTAAPFVIKRVGGNMRQAKRDQKAQEYTGIADGYVLAIVDKGLEFPWVIHVGYIVDGVTYEIKETARLKNEIVKVKSVPIGQRTSFVMGDLEVGDPVKVKYDVNDPKNALIVGNDGAMTI